MRDKCVHRVEFDLVEIERLRKGKYRMGASCERCHNLITLGSVLDTFVTEMGKFSKRLDALEEKSGGGNVKPVARTDT